MTAPANSACGSPWRGACGCGLHAGHPGLHMCAACGVLYWQRPSGPCPGVRPPAALTGRDDPQEQPC